MPVIAKIVEEMDVEQRQSPIVQALMAIDTKLDTILNLFAALDARQHRLEAANQPRTSSCVFCPEGEASHPSGRCPKYPDPVSRAVQASRLGLCDRCLRRSHDEPCDASCNHCRKPHNTLLCPIEALRKKIVECQEKAQTIVTMANKRIAYLSGMWKDTSDVMLKSDVSDSRGGALERISRGERTFSDVFSSAASALEAISTAKLQDELKKDCARLAKELRTFMGKLEEGAKSVERKAKSIPKSDATTETYSSDVVDRTKKTSAEANIPSKSPDMPKISPLLKGDRPPVLTTAQRLSPTAKLQKTQESLRLPSAQAQKELRIAKTPPTATPPKNTSKKLNSASSSASGSKEQVRP
ncbi:unnamed protein product [Cylicocyclus nassatus]|uniref:Uncharacterized protein n=1 Tax=Cylicocyclus nassatus TaxID=53992 RepID=A0AA36M1S6_CYLNA|nr:unnamed protein product [Cylicocyclus nassatus]